MNKIWVWLVPLFVLGMLSMAFVQAKDADGKTLYEEKGCNGCHGNDAKSPLMAAYPKLAGQNKDYLVIQTQDIRDDKRTNGQAGIMKATITGITDDEISKIADWLSSL